MRFLIRPKFFPVRNFKNDKHPLVLLFMYAILAVVVDKSENTKRPFKQRKLQLIIDR